MALFFSSFVGCVCVCMCEFFALIEKDTNAGAHSDNSRKKTSGSVQTKSQHIDKNVYRHPKRAALYNLLLLPYILSEIYIERERDENVFQTEQIIDGVSAPSAFHRAILLFSYPIIRLIPKSQVFSLGACSFLSFSRSLSLFDIIRFSRIRFGEIPFALPMI